MRRIRRTSAGLPPAMLSRVSAAFILSLTLHVFLIFGFSIAPDAGVGARTAVVHARLILTPHAATVLRVKAPRRDGVADSSQLAFIDHSAPAPNAVEPSSAPDPTPAPRDLDSVAFAGGDASGPTIPDPIHYPAKDLDFYPQAVQPITATYPDAARVSEVAGFVTLLVLIDETGKVIGTSVHDASPAGVFDQAAQDALAKTVFYPARKDGRMVRSRVVIKLEFDPEMTVTAQ